MKESKAVYVTKRDLKEQLLQIDYQLYHNRVLSTFVVPQYEQRSKDVGVQYNSKRDNLIFTCKKLSVLKKHPHARYYITSKQIYTYRRSRSFTDIGIGSVKAFQKKKTKRIRLPETGDRGVGSSDLTSFIRKFKQNQANSFYGHKKTSSKCIGGVYENAAKCVLSLKHSPIIQTKSGTTSPLAPTPVIEQQNQEAGSNTVEKLLVTTTTQIEKGEMKLVKVEEESIVFKPKCITNLCNKETKDVRNSITANSVDEPVDENFKEEKSFSSDSLLQHVHNLEIQSEIDPMENKLEREYRKMFSTKSKEGSIEKPIPDLKSASLLRRRFEALRRSLSKKEKSIKNIVLEAIASKKSSKVNGASHRDVSITSDPPSLEETSYSNTKISKYNPYSNPNKCYACPHHDTNTSDSKPSYDRRSYTGKKDPESIWSGTCVDSEYCTGVKGMFKLWGKKFNLEESDYRKHTPSSLEAKKNKKNTSTSSKASPKRQVEENKKNAIVKQQKPNVMEKPVTVEKKEGKKFFFFNKKSKVKDKGKECYKSTKGVTTGRCEVRDGLKMKNTKVSTPIPVENKEDKRPESYEEILRKAWLKSYLTKKIESKKSVNIRWNNNMYTASSSTVLSLMENVLETGVVLKSKSEIATDESSNFKSFTKRTFVQNVEAWMMPQLIPKQILPNTIYQSQSNDNNMEVRISNQKWLIDKSKAFAHKIEVILHSNNFAKLHNLDSSSEYLRIEIPKGFFSDTSSDYPQQLNQTSDEEVYQIVEYDMINSRAELEKTKKENKDDIEVTISVKNNSTYESKNSLTKMPTMKRDVIIQGSNVYIPKKCDVVGVGIITQRDVRDARNPILKIVEYESDDDSEHSIYEPRKCEFAESYLQDYYKNWTSLGIDLFSWCVSDSNVKCCSENESHASLNNVDCTKSCPNICDDHLGSTNASSNATSSCSLFDQGNNVTFFNNFHKKSKFVDDGRRVLPKDSLEVFKKRKLYAVSKKSCWISVEDRLHSVPTKEDRGASDTMIECPKLLKHLGEFTVQKPIKKQCNKHVSLPECDLLNEQLLRQSQSPNVFPGILSYKGSPRCDTCKNIINTQSIRKDNQQPKHAQLDTTKVHSIPEPICKQYFENKETPSRNQCSNPCHGTSRPRPKQPFSSYPSSSSSHSSPPSRQPSRPKSPSPRRKTSPPNGKSSPPSCPPSRSKSPPPPRRKASPPNRKPSPSCLPPPPSCPPTPPSCPPSPPKCPPPPKRKSSPPKFKCSPPKCASETSLKRSSPPPFNRPPPILSPPPCPKPPPSFDRPSAYPFPATSPKPPPSPSPRPCPKVPPPSFERPSTYPFPPTCPKPPPPSCNRPLASLSPPPCPKPPPPTCNPPSSYPPPPPSQKPQPSFDRPSTYPFPPTCPKPPKNFNRPLASPSPPPCPKPPPPSCNQPSSYPSPPPSPKPPPPCLNRSPPSPFPLPCPKPPRPSSYPSPPPCPKPPPISCNRPPPRPSPPPKPPPPCCNRPSSFPSSKLPPTCWKRHPPYPSPPPGPQPSPPCFNRPCPSPLGPKLPPHFSIRPPPCPSPPGPEPPPKLGVKISLSSTPPPSKNPRPPCIPCCLPKDKRSFSKKNTCCPPCLPPCGPLLPCGQTRSSSSRSLPRSPPRSQPPSNKIKEKPEKPISPYKDLGDRCAEKPKSQSREKKIICKPGSICGSPQCPLSSSKGFPWPINNQVSNQPSCESLKKLKESPCTSSETEKSVKVERDKDCLPDYVNIRKSSSCPINPPPRCPRPEYVIPQLPRPKPPKCPTKSVKSGIFLKVIPSKKKACPNDNTDFEQVPPKSCPIKQEKNPYLDNTIMRLNSKEKIKFGIKSGCPNNDNKDLEQVPSKSSKQEKPCPDNVLMHLNSREKISLGIKSEYLNKDDIRRPMDIKLVDENGQIICERKDYQKGCNWSNPTYKRSIPNLSNIYFENNINRVSTPLTVNEEASVGRNKDESKSKSDTSIANLIEIDFKLRVNQGDKITEVNIGKEDEKRQTKEKRSHLGKTPQEIFICKDNTKQCFEKSNSKNDINIRILIKNYKNAKSNKKRGKYTNPEIDDEFSRKISEKFHTVSTGYSNDLKDEISKVFSVHRAIIDLTSSTEKPKLQFKDNEEIITEKFKIISKSSQEIMSQTFSKHEPNIMYTANSRRDNEHFGIETSASKAKSDDLKLEKSIYSINVCDIKNNESNKVNIMYDKSEAYISFTHTDEHKIDKINKCDARFYVIDTDDQDASELCNKTSTDGDIDLNLKTTEEPNKTEDMIENLREPEVPIKVPTKTKSCLQDKKEILKAVFENANYSKKLNKKTRIVRLKDMLKTILISDNSEPEDIVVNTNELVPDLTYASIKPKYLKKSDSLNNYFQVESTSDSEKDNIKMIYPTEVNNSECSGKDSDEWSIDDGTNQGCLCRTLAAKLKVHSEVIDTGCCCKRKTPQHNKETNCDIRNEEDYLLLNYKSSEYVDVETQNSMYLCCNFNSPNISGHNTLSHVADMKLVAQVTEQQKSFKNIQDDVRKKKDSKTYSPHSSNKYNREFTNLINKYTKLGISEDDKIVFLESKSTKITVKEKFGKEMRRKERQEKQKHGKKRSGKMVQPADILQMYETKKAVLEIYAKKTVTDDGEHVVAKLPKFVYEKESEIYRNYEDLASDSHKSVRERNILRMSIKQ